MIGTCLKYVCVLSPGVLGMSLSPDMAGAAEVGFAAVATLAATFWIKDRGAAKRALMAEQERYADKEAELRRQLSHAWDEVERVRACRDALQKVLGTKCADCAGNELRRQSKFCKGKVTGK